MPKYDLDGVFDARSAHPDEAHSVLMRLIPRGSRVLELGCATGYLSGYMEETLGCRVTAMERDAESAAVARGRCHRVCCVDLDEPDALDAAREDAPYTVLLAAAVFEHLKHPERVLEHARDLLAPGALAVVSLPNVAHWRIRLKLLAGVFAYEDYGVMDRTHLRLYTVETGRALVEGQGFHVEQLLVAGSGVQNAVNALARRFDRLPPRAILPGLLGYELIFAARKA